MLQKYVQVFVLVLLSSFCIERSTLCSHPQHLSKLCVAPTLTICTQKLADTLKRACSTFASFILFPTFNYFLNSKKRPSKPNPPTKVEHDKDAHEETSACLWEGCTFEPTKDRTRLSAHCRDHVEQALRSDGKRYCKWGECSYSSSHKHDFFRHLAAHANLRMFRCDWPGCRYSAVLKGNLKIHHRGHSKVKPFKCPVDGCSYATAYQSHLRPHIRTHTNERPYPCQVEGCTYAAKTKGRLRDHQASHTQKKTYSCPVKECNFITAYKGNLKRHLKCHKKPEGAQ